jgi:hypothetical protein
VQRSIETWRATLKNYERLIESAQDEHRAELRHIHFMMAMQAAEDERFPPEVRAEFAENAGGPPEKKG